MTERFSNWKPPKFDEKGWTEYGWRCQCPEGLRLGKKVDIGCFSYLNAKCGIIIGDNVQIGSHCSIYSISTEDNKEGTIIIGDNTVIGTHSTIMPGITIGKNCVVGAYSFVTEDIPDNWLAYGIPCKLKRPYENPPCHV